MYDVIDPKPPPQSHRIHFGVITDHLEALLRPPVKNRILRRHRTGATFFYNKLKPMSTLCSHVLIVNCSFLYDVIDRKPPPRPPCDPSWGHLGANSRPSWVTSGPSWVILDRLGPTRRQQVIILFLSYTQDAIQTPREGEGPRRVTRVCMHKCRVF